MLFERDLTFGPDPATGAFANVVDGAACAAHPKHCDLSRGVVVNDAANTVTFHLVAPDPEFLARLSLEDAEAVPRARRTTTSAFTRSPPLDPTSFASLHPDRGRPRAQPVLPRVVDAARPYGYPDRIVFRRISSGEAEVTDVEAGAADYEYDGVPPDRMNGVETRFADQLYVNPTTATDVLVLNTRVAPFNNAQGPPSAELRGRPRLHRQRARTRDRAHLPNSCRLESPATSATAPTPSTRTRQASGTHRTSRKPSSWSPRRTRTEHQSRSGISARHKAITPRSTATSPQFFITSGTQPELSTT